METLLGGHDSSKQRGWEDDWMSVRYKEMRTGELLRETSIVGVWHQRCNVSVCPHRFLSDIP
jgi:hypothetical protein